MLPLKAVNHIGLVTSRAAESAAFYRDVLGFRPVQRPNFDFPGAWLYNYGLMIHLIHNDAAGSAGGEILTRHNHLALHTDDLPAVERALTERGIPYRTTVVPELNVRQVFFHDPDGHHIEIGTYPPTPRFLDEPSPAGG